MILVFCGPPASGKTEIAKRLAERLKGSRLISTAEFRRKRYRRISAEAERWAGRVDYLILDGTFHREEWRNSIKTIALKSGQEILTVYLKCSLQTCLKRNELRKDRVEEKAVRIVHEQMEEPMAPDIVIDTETSGIEEAVEGILRALVKNRGKQLEETPSQNFLPGERH